MSRKVQHHTSLVPLKPQPFLTLSLPFPSIPFTPTQPLSRHPVLFSLLLRFPLPVLFSRVLILVTSSSLSSSMLPPYTATSTPHPAPASPYSPHLSSQPRYAHVPASPSPSPTRHSSPPLVSPPSSPPISLSIRLVALPASFSHHAQLSRPSTPTYFPLIMPTHLCGCPPAPPHSN